MVNCISLVYQAVSLRWLAGGSYHDICALFGLGPGGFFSEKGPLWPTLYAIHEALSSEIVFDISEKSCRKSADGFLLASRGQIDGCVCAVDGLVIKTRQPRAKELGASVDVKAYRNRKGCFAVLIMAGCDYDCRFKFFTCRHTGSTNDAMAIQGSEVNVIFDCMP
jgi:hypothetical protein